MRTSGIIFILLTVFFAGVRMPRALPDTLDQSAANTVTLDRQ